MHRILSSIDPDALDRAVRKSAAARHPPEGALAIDGKSAPLNRLGGADDGRMLLAAVAHGSGVIAGQVASDSAGGEILGARRLILELDVAGRVPALDALHSYPKTARLIIDKGAGYVLPVKGNRRSLLDDLKAFDPHFDAVPGARTLDKGHGRIKERVCALVLLDSRPDSLALLPGRRQAFRIMRRRTVIRTGRETEEFAYGSASLGPEGPGPAEILALNRGHWEIENRLHFVRDFSCNEDQSWIRIDRLPRHLASLANAALSIVRLRGRFPFQPQAHRHYAARHGEALREVIRASGISQPARAETARADGPRGMRRPIRPATPLPTLPDGSVGPSAPVPTAGRPRFSPRRPAILPPAQL